MEKEPINFDVLHPEPLLIVVSGPSGVGKDSVVKELLQRIPQLHFMITTTSRSRRENEIDGIDYFFVSKERFEELIAQNELIEYALVYDQYKGGQKQQIRDAWASGKDVIMRVDVQGAATYRKLFPEALLIFLLPPSEAELIKRLVDRKTESKESIDLRMATTRKEMESLSIFDYLVYNPHGKMDEAVEIIENIISAEHHRVNQRKVRI